MLDVFSHDQPNLTIAEIARRLKLPKATAHRYASSLVSAGLMSQNEDGTYALGFRLIGLGALARENLPLATVCGPAVQWLATETGEAVMLGVPDWVAGETVIVDRRIESQQVLSVLAPVGGRTVIRSGLLSKALLMGLSAEDAAAFLDGAVFEPLTENTVTDVDELLAQLVESRERGYVLEENEVVPHVSGVGVPVQIDGGRPAGAIAIIGPTTRIKGRIHELGETLRDATQELRTSPAAGG